jgi:hypothetical protein
LSAPPGSVPALSGPVLGTGYVSALTNPQPASGYVQSAAGAIPPVYLYPCAPGVQSGPSNPCYPVGAGAYPPPPSAPGTPAFSLGAQSASSGVTTATPGGAPLGPPPTNTISAPSGTFTSGGVNSGGQLTSSTAGVIAQVLGGGGASGLLSSGAGSGGISGSQLQALTSRLGSMNLNTNDLSSMGHALGLNDQQISQIQQNIQASQQPATPGVPQPYYPQQPSAPTGLGAGPGSSAPASIIEAKYQQLDNPLVTVAPPTPSNLTQFGYGTFMSPVATFAPTQNVPITDDY